MHLLGYFAEVLSSSSYRYWISGAAITDSSMTLISCDPGGALISQEIQLDTQHGYEAFCTWVVALGFQSLSRLGFANLCEDGATDVSQTLELQSPNIASTLLLGDQLYCQYGVFGRRTTLYKTIFNGSPAIVKLSWQVTTRALEVDIIKRARMVNSINTPEILDAWEVDIDLPSRVRPENIVVKRQSGEEGAVNPSILERRVLEIIIMPFYLPIYELTGETFMSAFWEIMQCMTIFYLVYISHFQQATCNSMKADACTIVTLVSKILCTVKRRVEK